MAKVLLHIIVSHRSNPHLDYPTQWLDDDRICSIVTCKEIADLCAPLVASASPVRIHRTGSHEQPPAVCCEATVQAVRRRGALFEVEFTDARALHLAPTIRPDGKESWYFAEAGSTAPGEVGDYVSPADAAPNETPHSQTEPSVQPSGDPVLSPPKTATSDSSPSADRESRPRSKHLELLQRGIEDWNFARKSKPDVKPNLQGFDLREVLAKAVRFASVQLAGADMRGANLAGLKFYEAVLVDASLAGADLTGAVWQKAQGLSGFSLQFAESHYMNLRAANLEGANLSRTTFEAPWLTGTNHCCPAKSRTESTGCRDRVVPLGSPMLGGPVEWAFFQKA